MAEILSVDTCFLIDLEREQRKRISGPARSFLEGHPEAEFRLSLVAFGEFAAGLDRPDHPRLDLVRLGYDIMPTDEETALVYARICRNLRERNCLIGANDLWIAAHALQHRLPLVTRNASEFSRVPDLLVIGY